MATLNAAFNPSGFTFRLASVDRTTNATWFTGVSSGTQAEADAASLLKQVLLPHAKNKTLAELRSLDLRTAHNVHDHAARHV